MATIVRSGDPRAGLALALRTSGNTVDALVAGAVLASRLNRDVPGFDVHVGLGVVTITGVLEAAAARETVLLLDAVLRREIAESELSTSETVAARRRLEQLAQASDWGLERQICLSDGASLPASGGGNSTTLIANARRWQKEALVQHNARWGVVGESAIVAEVVAGIANLPSWPVGERARALGAPTDSAVWREGKSNRLSLVVRTSAVQAAFAAKRVFDGDLWSSPIKPSALRVNALPEGGCLRVDFDVQGRDEDAPEALLASARRFLKAVRSASTEKPGAMASAALEEPFAARAAELSAITSLSCDSSGPDRIGMTLESPVTMPAPKRTPEQLLSLVAGELPHGGRVELVTRVEPGQGRIYALLASPCVPRLESARLIGSAALFLEAAVERFSGQSGVSLEAWVDSEGAGLLASTGRRSPSETATEQAERLGSVLGMALATTPDKEAFWRARTSLLSELGPGERPALWQALGALAPDSPGLVAPRGTFATVESIKPNELLERVHSWRVQELRLAVVANEPSGLPGSVERGVSYWLDPYRFDSRSCPRTPAAKALALDSQVEAAKESGDASASIAVRLPTEDPLDGVYAEWLSWALALPGGWLDSLRQRSAAQIHCEATLVGGRERRGLVVAVGASADQVDAAVTAVKGLFSLLAEGNLPYPTNLAALAREHRERELRRLADPRQRVIELWKGEQKRPEPTEAGFLSYLRRAFAHGEVSVVRAAPKPALPESDVLSKGSGPNPSKTSGAPARPRKRVAKPGSASRP